jgi:hypothetical protein
MTQALMTLPLFAKMAMPTGDSLNPHVPFYNLQGWMCTRSVMSLSGGAGLSLTFASWNRIGEWLRQLKALRDAA